MKFIDKKIISRLKKLVKKEVQITKSFCRYNGKTEKEIDREVKPLKECLLYLKNIKEKEC